MGTITSDYTMIDTDLYKVFYTVGRCGKISAAAERLFVSQPAVSKSIKKLENLIGCTLFVRSVRGVTLTTEGSILYQYVKDGFHHLQNGELVLQQLKNRTKGIVRIGISNTLCKYYFLPYLERFHQQYPGIRLSIINRTSPQTLQLLEQGMIDFGIISIPENQTRFLYRELLTINDIFVANTQYPELRQPTSLDQLNKYPLMMLEDDNFSRDHIETYLQQHNSRLTPEIEIGSMDFLIDFARIGLGIALVIRNFIKEELAEETLVEIEVTPPIPARKIGLVRPDKVPLSLAAETFIASICGDAVENTPVTEQ